MSAITDSTSGETGDVFNAEDTSRETEAWFQDLKQRTTEVAEINFTATVIYGKQPQVTLLANAVGSDFQFYGTEVNIDGQFRCRSYSFLNGDVPGEAKKVIDQKIEDTQKLVQRNPFYNVTWDLEAYDKNERLLNEKHWEWEHISI